MDSMLPMSASNVDTRHSQPQTWLADTGLTCFGSSGGPILVKGPPLPDSEDFDTTLAPLQVSVWSI
jgi:hypothetical protein